MGTVNALKMIKTMMITSHLVRDMAGRVSVRTPVQAGQTYNGMETI